MPRYREHLPGARLAPFVTCFWELESAGESHRVLPDGAMDIIYALGQPRAQIVGTMTRALVTGEGQPMSLVGVRFRPGAARDLLGVAARELRDDTADLADAWGGPGRELDARLAEACHRRAALGWLATALERRARDAARPDPRLDAAVRALATAGGELPVLAVAARTGLGERQLNRLFRERVGYGPKLFARVMRLQRAAHLADRLPGRAASWADLAVACGYTDQPHLIREFQALAGLTPAAYARRPAMSEIDNRDRVGSAMLGS